MVCAPAVEATLNEPLLRYTGPTNDPPLKFMVPVDHVKLPVPLAVTVPPSWLNVLPAAPAESATLVLIVPLLSMLPLIRRDPPVPGLIWMTPVAALVSTPLVFRVS